jgi:hypothetical protein
MFAFQLWEIFANGFLALAQTDAAASVWSVRDLCVRAAALGIYDRSHEFS